MANLYNKAGLINIPVGYSDGFLYNIKPTDNTLGFRFDRASAATRVNKEGLIEQVGYFGPELVQNGNFSELGPELVTNGDFATDSDWTKGTGWSISGGKANCDGSQTSQTTLESIPNLALGVGNLFKITFDISNYSSGQIDLITLVGTGGPEITNINANGSYTAYSFGESTGNSRIQIIANSDFVGSIDNVSVKQVDPNDYWILAGSNVSISNNKLNFVNAVTNSEFAQQVIVAPIGKTYKITLEVSNLGSGETIKIRHPYQDTTINSNGLHTVYGVGDYANFFRITPNSSTATFSIDNVSVTEVLGDKPRIDYTDSLTSPSFLLEPQSTNLLPYSEDFSQSSYIKDSGITIGTQDNISPGVIANATRIDVTNSGRIYSNVTSSTYYSTVFIKAGTFSYFKLAGKQVDLVAETIVGGSIKSYANGWYRVGYTYTGNRPFQVQAYPDNTYTTHTTSGNYYIWGAQAEALSYATSYIPTAGSTVTRAAETCNGAGNASTFNSTEGVLYAEIAALADDGTNRIISISDGTTTNRVLIQYYTSSNVVRGFASSSGGSTTITHTLTNVQEFLKIAFKYKSGDYSLFIDGIKVGVSTSTITPPGLNELAFDNGNGDANFYGKTKGVYVFNEALTDDELQQLTGPEYNSFAALAAAYNYTVI